jgi:putative peptidoglycan lipid II flippase
MVALVSQSMLDIVVRAFAAQQDTWTPLKVSFFTTALNIGLALVLTRSFAEGGIEHGGPPLANGIAVLVEASIGLTILHFRWKGVDARHIFLDLAKALVAAAVMAITLSLVLPLLEGSTILTLAVGGVVGIAVYLSVAFLLGVREVYTIPMMILHQASGGRLGAAASES